MVMPMMRHLQLDCERRQRQAHAKGYRGDERKRGCWYRRQSTAMSFITHVANLIPRSTRDVRMQPFSVHGRIPQFEGLLGASLGQGELQSTLNQSPQSCPLASGDQLRLLQ